jgi:hypothetical protein
VPTATAHATDPVNPQSPLRPAGDDLDAEHLAALHTLPMDFLLCRADGHQMRTSRGYGVIVANHQTGHEHTEVNWAWRAQDCLRCGYSVERHFDQHYLPLRGGRQGYPEGYLFKGMGRVHPALARRVLWEKQVGNRPKPRKAKAGKGK